MFKKNKELNRRYQERERNGAFEFITYPVSIANFYKFKLEWSIDMKNWNVNRILWSENGYVILYFYILYIS